MTNSALKLGDKVPNMSEESAVGPVTTKIMRGTPEFFALIKNTNSKILFKNEEGDESDLYMTVKLQIVTDLLADLVAEEWTDVKLRVTEAWDGQDEHSVKSTHYEARGLDFTTSDRDQDKYGRLASLAVKAGFQWVFYENIMHVHASVNN